MTSTYIYVFLHRNAIVGYIIGRKKIQTMILGFLNA